MKIIGDYTLLDDLTTKDAGFSRWGFCKKEGHEYFIKEFLTPVYPLQQGPLSESQFFRKRAICEAYQAEKERFYDVLRQCRTGNIVVIEDFFRFKNRYYAVTDKIASKPLSVEEIASFDREKKEVLLCAVLYSIATLHEKGVVHSDIKPDNVLAVIAQSGYCTAKIIDFDAGFFVSDPPKEIQGDLVYFAPEVSLFMHGDDTVILSEKIDIFALGILFHQYWCGELPGMDGDYLYVSDAVLNSAEIMLNDRIPLDVQEIIRKMLSKHPEERPSAREILSLFKKEDEAMLLSEEAVSVHAVHEEQICHKNGLFAPNDLG